VSATGEGLSRVSTGSEGADLILGGGFPANSINIIMGAPGTGKTLFVQQLALHNADGHRPILYLTTLSEPLAKVVTYLQQTAFHDETKIGSSVRYEDLGAALMDQGIGAMATRLREAIRRDSPKIIIVDSFKAVHDLSSSPAEMRRLVADLAGLLSAYDTTTFLVGEYLEEEIARYPEFAVADAIVELGRRKRASSDERYLRVSKLRGASYREGTHGFRITAGGLQFYPRLISPELPFEYAEAGERISSGVAGLDSLLGGGLWRGTCTLVAGPTGSGKTTCALQFCLEGVRRGEPGLYLNFQENPTQLGQLIRSLGAGLHERAGPAPLWHTMYSSPVELQIDSLIGEAFALIREAGIRRVVVDGIGDLLLASGDPQRVHDYLYALTQYFARNGISSLLTYETRMALDAGRDRLTEELRFSGLTDCIILLDMEIGGSFRRTARVLKARNSAHSLDRRAMEITASGIRIT
jgi:circadian clock protein KaiC